MAASQQLLRIDAEEDRPASPAETESLLERVRALITQADVVIFEDYDKGALTPESIAAIVSMARSRGIPTVVDPKKRNFLAYSGCSLFKPNLKELKEGLKLEFDARDPRQLGQAVRQLCEAMPIGAALITLSEWGVYATDFTEEHHIPAHKREIADVSGAGDTVVSIASLCLAAGEGLARAAALANLGGGLVCEHLGVVPVSKERLLQEALRL
jgi:rfaE bifunctional protein kinase chain/domain